MDDKDAQSNRRAEEHDDVPRSPFGEHQRAAFMTGESVINGDILVGCETASGERIPVMFHQFAIRSLCLVTKGKKGWQAENVRALQIGFSIQVTSQQARIAPWKNRKWPQTASSLVRQRSPYPGIRQFVWGLKGRKISSIAWPKPRTRIL